MSEHAWFHEQLPLYLTAGLDAASVERLHQHAAECEECGRELKSMESLDHALLDVLAEARPDAALESKLIARLREAETTPATPSFIANRDKAGASPQPKKRRWLKILGIAASVILLVGLGGVGAVLSEMLDEEGSSSVAQNNLRQLSLIDRSESMSTPDEFPYTQYVHGRSFHGSNQNGDLANLTDAWFVPGFTYLPDAPRKHSSITGGIIGGTNGKAERGGWIGDLDGTATEFDTDINYNIDRRSDVSVPGSTALDRLGDKPGKAPSVADEFGVEIGLQSREHGKPVEYWNMPMAGESGKDDSKARMLGRSGGKSRTILNEELAESRTPPKSEAGTPPSEHDLKSAFGLSQTYSPPTHGRTNLGSIVNGTVPSEGKPADDGPVDRLSAVDKRTPPKGETTWERREPRGETETLSRKSDPVKSLDDKATKVFDDFFAQAPTTKKPEENAGGTTGAGSKKSETPKEQPPAILAAGQDDPKQKGSTEVKGPTSTETRRVVIRSGDIEFEVDSFDDAAAIVTRLTNATKGGFVATTNSHKRENGKMEGTVVVRVPPTELDGLVEALRKALSKAGELKGQNIGSQDVTKQFVDTESALRANRITEERLLRVIKEGKGEIKDLVVAEEKLGKVRVEIERMEGELRYYANLAALSTLSVKLTEKDIQVAAKLIETATVKASIEVEDVEKARQEVQKAIAELKGRVIKSESKQQSTGEFNVALEFETPADATDAMRDRLRKLGTAAMLDTEIAQRTEGGGSAPKDGKTEKGPTTFKLALVNLGQLQARDLLRLSLAVRDVIESHHKVRDAVIEAKGSIRHSSLDEKDRQNVTARLEFDVPAGETKRFSELLASLGERLSVSTERRPENERATAQRTSFRVDFSPASRIEPRENHALGIEVRDVETTLESLEAQVKGVGGRITVPSQRNQETNGRVTAVAVYDVPLAESEKMLKRIKSVGLVRVQRAKHNPTAPDGPLAIARFEVTLSNQELIVPRDQGLGTQLRSGLQIALRGLLLSLSWLIVAVVVVGPWVLLIYGIYRLVRRMRRPATPTA